MHLEFFGKTSNTERGIGSNIRANRKNGNIRLSPSILKTLDIGDKDYIQFVYDLKTNKVWIGKAVEALGQPQNLINKNVVTSKTHATRISDLLAIATPRKTVAVLTIPNNKDIEVTEFFKTNYKENVVFFALEFLTEENVEPKSIKSIKKETYPAKQKIDEYVIESVDYKDTKNYNTPKEHEDDETTMIHNDVK